MLEVRATFEYEVSLDYLRGALSIALLEKGIRTSRGNFLKNLKQIAELRPLDADRAGFAQEDAQDVLTGE